MRRRRRVCARCDKLTVLPTETTGRVLAIDTEPIYLPTSRLILACRGSAYFSSSCAAPIANWIADKNFTKIGKFVGIRSLSRHHIHITTGRRRRTPLHDVFRHLSSIIVCQHLSPFFFSFSVSYPSLALIYNFQFEELRMYFTLATKLITTSKKTAKYRVGVGKTKAISSTSMYCEFAFQQPKWQFSRVFRSKVPTPTVNNFFHRVLHQICSLNRYVIFQHIFYAQINRFFQFYFPRLFLKAPQKRFFDILKKCCI